MIKLSEILSEKGPCWSGYKIGNPKTKISSRTGERVNNCVPINELGENDYIYEDILKYFDKSDIETQNKILAVINKYKQYDNDKVVENRKDLAEYIREWEKKYADEIYKKLQKEAGLNEAFFIGEDDINEYDVENADDIKEFIEFMQEYQHQLNEADCDCLLEAEYQGRTVPLGKPMRGDSKKFKVYVKNPKTGKVVKVNFGAKGMNIKKNNPVRRKAFRARHNCANPGPRTKARYWSCRKW
jgi:hypothetical protein